ncbi:MAG: hypothetical protein LBK98_09765, partial [Peptococcaceae bacterium]|nr:hypothetical protein [Peptococcaceae bacterium]
LLWFGRRPAPERGLRPGQGLEPEPPPAAATASVLTLTPAPDAASLAAGLTALTREAFAALNER